MKKKVSILILIALFMSLSQYLVPAAGEVFMGEYAAERIEVYDEAYAFPLFIAFKQPSTQRPFSLYFIKADAEGLSYLNGGWQRIDGYDTNKLMPLYQTSDGSGLNAIKFWNAPSHIPVSWFVGDSDWTSLSVYICIDEESTTTGLADISSNNPNCGRLTFINKIDKTISYAVTPAVIGTGGSISPSAPVTVNAGKTRDFVVTPETGYSVVTPIGGTCGGTLAGNIYTTNAITADCTVSVSFKAVGNTYTVTLSAGTGGSISPNTPVAVDAGKTMDFVVTTETGYSVVMPVGGTCGGFLVGNIYTTNAITADCAASVTFQAVGHTYTVTPSVGIGGSIRPNTLQTVNAGSTKDFVVTPSTGYSVVTPVGGTCSGVLIGNTYTTNAITANCTVNVIFKADNSTPGGTPGGITIGNCTSSSISMADVITVEAPPDVKQTASGVSVTDNCRKGVSYTASVTGNSPWLSVPGSGNSQIVVTVNTKGMKGGSYNGTIKISSPGLTTANVSVKLTVTGPTVACTPRTAVVSPKSISQTNGGNVSVAIKDDCGNSLSYTGVNVKYIDGSGWITVPASGSGQMVVYFKSSGLTAGKTYKGSIEVTPDGYSPVSIDVSLTISASSTASGDITVFDATHDWYKLWISPNKPYYFSFIVAPNTKITTSKIEDYTQATSEPGGHNVDMLIKYAGESCAVSQLPTPQDLFDVKAYCAPLTACQPKWISSKGRWSPARYDDKKGSEFFYSLSRDSIEFIGTQGNPLLPGCYYVMLYNTGTGRAWIAASHW